MPDATSLAVTSVYAPTSVGESDSFDSSNLTSGEARVRAPASRRRRVPRSRVFWTERTGCYNQAWAAPSTKM